MTIPTKRLPELMTKSRTDLNNLEVWYDGECVLCQGSRRACEIRDTEKRLVFRDFRMIEETNLPVARDQHEATLWAKTSDGKLFSGFDAWRRILASLPGWHWLAWLTGVPPIPTVGRPLYALVAKMRSRFSH